ncbi:MAG: helix-turn-helix transcriptional regulator [Cyclobacteriaceae bacterium]
MSEKFGDRMMQARKEKGLSREELAKKIGTSGPIVGRYERNDMMPSVEIATKIADALAVSLDFLVGKSSLIVKDTNILERMEDIAKLPEDKKIELFNVMDAYLRDFKTSRAYSK